MTFSRQWIQARGALNLWHSRESIAWNGSKEIVSIITDYAGITRIISSLDCIRLVSRDCFPVLADINVFLSTAIHSNSFPFSNRSDANTKLGLLILKWYRKQTMRTNKLNKWILIGSYFNNLALSKQDNSLSRLCNFFPTTSEDNGRWVATKGNYIVEKRLNLLLSIYFLE